MRFFAFAGAAALLVSCDARPTSSVVFEKVEDSPVGWVLDKAAKVDKDESSITLKIHLVNENMDAFHKLAMDVRAPFEASLHFTNRVCRSQHQATHNMASTSTTRA